MCLEKKEPVCLARVGDEDPGRCAGSRDLGWGEGGSAADGDRSVPR